MQTITIDPKALAAVRIFAADQDIRYYLNAVYVEATSAFTRLVATNGHMLGLHDHSTVNELGSNYVNTLVPLDAIDTLKAKLDGVPIALSLADDGKSGALSQGSSSVNFAPVDGRFPDYRRVLPEKVSGEMGLFDQSLLTRIFKAQKIFSKKFSPLIWHSGKHGTALFELRGCDTFIGVVMPMNPNGVGKPYPTPPSTSRARTDIQKLKVEESNEDLV